MFIPTSVRRIFFLSFAFAAVVYFFTAWNNHMYLHPDELYQIVEFASLKLGITPLSDISWEYRDQIRPGFQPLLCYGVFKCLIALKIEDHFTHLFILRFISACFTLFSVAVFCRMNLTSVKEGYWKPYIIITFLFWVPFMYGARFSSESWSGNFMLLAVSALLYIDKRQPLFTGSSFYLAGALLGFAFLCRFQSAFFIVGVVGWLLFVKRIGISDIISIAAGGITVLFLGLLIDHWLYGDWVFTPWKYFESNIIKGVASHFGTRPFYYYFLWMFGFFSPPIGFIVLLAFVVLFIQQFRSIYTWLLFPFLIAHSVIGHKEPRFLLPMMNFLPVVVMLAYQGLNQRYDLSFSKWNAFFKKSTIAILLLFNFLFLLILVLLVNHFSTDPTYAAGKVHSLSNGNTVDIYYTDLRSHPFILPKATIEKDIYPAYLQNANIRNIKVASFCVPDTLAGIKLIATNSYEWKHDTCSGRTSNEYKIWLRSFPQWVDNLPVQKLLGKDAAESFQKNEFYILRKGDIGTDK